MKCSANKLFPKNCFNPTCKCKELKIVREVTLRCSNCNCGVKIEEKKMKPHDSLYDPGFAEDLLFTVVKDRKDES